VKRVLAGLVPVVGACTLLMSSAAVAGTAPVLQSIPMAHLGDAIDGGSASVTVAGGVIPPVPGVHAYTDTYTVQHPYNLPVSARFSVDPGPVYNAWVLKGDKPLRPGSGTGPRTEMRWALNWSRGLHIWEADVLVDAGTEKTAIMQVKSDNGGREAIYAQVVHGNLYNVSGGGGLVLSNVLGRWFHMACAYDPASGVSRIWVNGQLVSTGHYPRPASTIWYFKNGVYYNGGGNLKSEAHFKNIQFWSA
jgi:hypothetical protein